MNNLDIILELKNKYEIDVDNIIKNEDSTDGNVYIVYTETNNYVIKLYKDYNKVISLIELHSRLVNNNFNVPKVILSSNNKPFIEINDNYLVLYSFMEGKQISDVKMDNLIISLTAQALRRFHNITSNMDDIGLKLLPFEDISKTNRCSALHFDLTKHNIFINNLNEIGFIDLDDSKYGQSVCDVAIIIGILFFSKTRGVDINGTNKFIDEYYGNDLDLKSKEKPLIKYYALKWIDYIMDGNSFDSSTKESFIVKRKLIEDNLDL